MTGLQVVEDIETIADDVGRTTAAAHAEDVDAKARFPHEAVADLRDRGCLSAMVPRELGGGGASQAQIAAAVRALARHCSATALVFAMHTMEVGNLARFGTTPPLLELQREIVADQLLFANANSEVGSGGDVGTSACALETSGGEVTLTKHALAISYGEYADVIVATARPTPDSAATEQSYVVCRDFSVDPQSEWNPMGLRGTCSRSFILRARIDPALIYPVPFSLVGSGGGLHGQLLFLSAVWIGLAEAAAGTAHAYVRAAARREVGTVPRSALRLAELSTTLDAGRALLAGTAAQVDAADADSMQDPGLLASLRALKVSSSRTGVAVTERALEICGIAGYQRGTPFTVERLHRDACGGLVMVSNDRYLWANGQMLTARKRI